ncbi:hypothetical protein SMU70_08663, partial [Streptococcus mutans NLML5]
ILVKKINFLVSWRHGVSFLFLYGFLMLFGILNKGEK